MTNVAADVVEQRAVTRGAHAFFGLLDAAKLENRETARFGGRYAVPDLVGRGQIDEGPHLLVQTKLGATAAKNPRQHRSEPMKKDHAPSSTLAIANEMRSHRRLCCSSCFRPAAVIA